MSSEAVVALYDFRSKQNYIYNTNQIKEIVGASAIITHAYKRFLKKLEQKNILINHNCTFTDESGYINSDDTFQLPDFLAFDGEVIYVGGGNMYIIYKDKETYLSANRIFSKMLLDETYSLQLVCACTNYTGEYEKDRTRLYLENARIKNTEQVTVPTALLPFTELDRKTSLPIVKKNREQKKSFSQENIHKLEAYHRIKKSQAYCQSEKILDNLVTEKGIESLLAIIYIDGNGLGDRIKALMGDMQDYAKCTKEIRNFSNMVQESFVTKPMLAIEERLKAIVPNVSAKNAPVYRRIIGGGDEITIICNARYALEVVKTYFECLKENEFSNTACAGIAIFHSHDPFIQAYKIAEECCENGKKKNRQNGNNNCFIDYHFCNGYINDLDLMRETQENGLTARPYCYTCNTDNEVSHIEDFERVAHQLQQIGRANAKGLRDAILIGESYFLVELERLKACYKEDFTLLQSDKQQIFDVCIVYDIWVNKEEEQ